MQCENKKREIGSGKNCRGMRYHLWEMSKKKRNG